MSLCGGAKRKEPVKCVQLSTVKDVPVKSCCWLQASYKPDQISLLPQLLNAHERGNPHGRCYTQSSSFWDLLAPTTPPDIWPLNSRLRMRSCTLTRTCSVALCPVQFAGSAAEHNTFFTVGQLPRAEQERRWCRKVEGGKERSSMIMYELSAVLCGMRKGCSGAFKKKIIMSGYRNTSMNTDFYWLMVLSLFLKNMSTSSVKLLLRV